MTPEIKQRIEQIRNGEVPEGYKKTKYGIFPSHWKVDKLGNYLQELRELSNEIEKYPIYSSSRKGLLPQSQYYDKREAVTTNLGYKKVPNGYVTYRHMSDDDIFRFNKNTTEDIVLVSSEYPVFNCNTNGNIDYILPLLNDSPRFKYYCRIQKMGGTRTRLYYKNLCQYTTTFPPLKEQQKIAKILSAQDKVIECYEKKIEQLKQMKKYYLQNMFPKRGETVPKIRFKGFTDPWEQHKVEDLLIERNEQAPQSENYPLMAYVANEGVTPKGDRYDRSALVNDTVNKLYKRTEFNDYIYSSNNLESGSIGLNKYGKASISPVYSIFYSSNLSDPSFIGYRLIKNDFIYEMVKYRQGVIYGQWRIHESDFKKISILVPTLAEQKVIGSFFDYLDQQITILQKNYEEEKKKKKALQQLLLTGIVRVKHE